MSLFVTSCALFDKKSDNTNDTGPNGKTEVSVKSGDFKSLYGAYFTAQMNEVQSIFDVKNSKIWKEAFSPKKSNGDVKFKFGAGQFGSIDAMMKIAAHASGFDSKITFSDVFVDIKDKTGRTGGDITIKAKEVSLVQSLFQKFVKFQGLELPEKVATQIEKFKAKEHEGKWIELPTGMNDKQMEVMKKLLTINDKYIKDLIVKYPVLKAKGAAKIEGTKNTFEVEADADSMVAIAKEVAKKLGTEKEFTAESEKEIRDGAKEFNENTTITLTFDEKDHLFLDGKMDIKGQYGDEKGKVVANFTFNTDKNKVYILGKSPKESENQGEFLFDFKKDKEIYTVDSYLKDEDTEKYPKAHAEFTLKDEELTMLKVDINVPDADMKITGEFKDENHKFTGNGKVTVNDEVATTFNFDGAVKNKELEKFNLNIDVPEEKANVKAMYDNKDGNFKGNFVVKSKEEVKFTASFEGSIKGETVQTLKIDADAADVAKILIDTKDAKDGIMQGKITFESVNPMASGKVTADLGLGLGKEIFALQLKNIEIESDSIPAEAKSFTKGFFLDLVARGTEEKTDEKVTMPTEYVPFKEIQEKIEAQRAEEMKKFEEEMKALEDETDAKDADDEEIPEDFLDEAQKNTDVEINEKGVSVELDGKKMKVGEEGVSAKVNGKDIEVSADGVSVSQ